MAELTKAEAQSWFRVISDFPGYYANFQKNFSSLIQQSQYIREKHPELLPEYNRLIISGNKTYGNLMTLKNNVDRMKTIWSDVTGWLKSAIGLSGLGIAPIIWGGIAAGTAIGILTAAGNWITEVSTFAARVEEGKRLEAGGLSPQQATAELTKRYGEPGSSSGGSIFGIPLKMIMFGAIALVMLPTILQLVNQRR